MKRVKKPTHECGYDTQPNDICRHEPAIFGKYAKYTVRLKCRSENRERPHHKDRHARGIGLRVEKGDQRKRVDDQQADERKEHESKFASCVVPHVQYPLDSPLAEVLSHLHHHDVRRRRGHEINKWNLETAYRIDCERRGVEMVRDGILVILALNGVERYVCAVRQGVDELVAKQL